MIYIFAIIMIYTNKIITMKFKNSKLIYCILTGFFLYLVMALKDPFLGKSDTLTIYYPSFENVIFNTMKYVFLRYREESALFYIVTKLISYFTHNLILYYALLEIPIIYSVTKIIYKHSKMPELSFLAFFSLNFYFFNFIALKNSVAFAFLMLAMDSYIEEKNKKTILYIILATLFHYTALIFLVALIIKKVKFGYKNFIFLIGILLITIFMKNTIFNYIFSIIDSGRYSVYSNRTETINLLMFTINILILSFSKLITNDNYVKQNSKLFNLLWIGTMFSIFTVLLAEFSRISMYFSVSSIILIPNTLKQIEKKNIRIFMCFIIEVFMIIYCFYSVIPNLNLNEYEFFWNSMYLK